MWVLYVPRNIGTCSLGFINTPLIPTAQYSVGSPKETSANSQHTFIYKKVPMPLEPTSKSITVCLRSTLVFTALKISPTRRKNNKLGSKKAHVPWVSRWPWEPVNGRSDMVFQSRSLNLRERRKEGVYSLSLCFSSPSIKYSFWNVKNYYKAWGIMIVVQKKTSW